MNIRIALLVLLATVFSSTSFATIAAANSPAGAVIAIRKEAWSKRNKRQTELTNKSPVFTGESLITSAVGRLQVLFMDNTTLMLAPKSSVFIDEYIYTPKSTPKMTLGITKGLTRIITGKIVEGNPKALTVTTPTAKVGIQGTIAVFEVEDKTENFYLLEITPGKNLVIEFKNGSTINLTTPGTMIESVQGVPSAISAITPEQMKKIAAATAPPATSTTGVSSKDLPVALTLPTAMPSVLALAIQTERANNTANLLPPLKAPAKPAGTFPEVPAVPSAFSGSYAGSFSGVDGRSPAEQGTFAMDIKGLSSAPMVTNFEMNFTSKSPGIPDTIRSLPDYKAPVSTNGNFILNGQENFTLTQHQDFTAQGRVNGGEINFDWRLTDSDTPFDASGQGAGSKQ